MTAEIAAMGARTPHELMRCVEVTFIRDCAELAARASLARTESRWGLYHDRPDHPGRDDAEWFWHLNLRRAPGGVPQLVKRAVAPYIVPVSEFSPPVREVSEIILPAGTPGTGQREQARPRGPGGQAPVGRPPQLLELLRLAETQPSIAQLQPYLGDQDARVRRAAISVLTETAPPGVGLTLALAVGDGNGTVRHAAAAGLRELSAVLCADDSAADEALGQELRRRLVSTDPVVRCAILDVLRETRAGDAVAFAGRGSRGGGRTAGKRHVRSAPRRQEGRHHRPRPDARVSGRSGCPASRGSGQRRRRSRLRPRWCGTASFRPERYAVLRMSAQFG